MTTAVSRTAAFSGGVALLAVLPLFASEFVVAQIATKTLWLGIVALSLIFLAAYAGLISLAQPAIAATAGYVVGYLTVRKGWEPLDAVPVALAACIMLALLIGIVTVRSSGIYYFMLTLAVGIFLYYFAFEAQEWTGGFDGLNGVPAPTIATLDKGTSVYVYSLAAAVTCYLSLRYLTRTPLGIALQGVRDNQPRMVALGYRPGVVRIVGLTIASVVAGVGGVLAAWYSGSISPAVMDLQRIIDVVVVAVIGGMYRLEGAWIGAFIVTILQTYVSDYTGRYNTVIGTIFVAVVLLFPGGIADGLARSYRIAARAGRQVLDGRAVARLPK